MPPFAYPALHTAADLASNAAQRRLFWSLGINLGLFVVVSLLSATHADASAIWFICGALLIGNFVLTLALAILKPEENWFAARAIAESVKTATWRFVSRAEPFEQDQEQPAVAAFANRLRDIFSQNKRFSSTFTEALDGQQVPTSLLLHRRLDLAQRKGRYRDFRILDQKKWYSDKARGNRIAARIALALTLIAMAAAILLHFWRANDAHWQYWPGDATVTIALSLLAWLQAKRYLELSETYSIAAQDIALVEAGLYAVNTEVEFSQFVADAENAFSREHTQWIARKDR